MEGYQPSPRPANGHSHHQRHSVAGVPDARMQPGQKGAVPMPVGGPAAQSMGPGGMVPRSPPKNKNTQHVPCKFFLQGQCQAGQTCPFSHNIESATRPTPCKYFAKGGCKFGRKCALLHITPDGVVVNRMPPPQYAQSTQAYVNGQGGYGPPPPGLLSMQAQAAFEARQNGHDAGDYTEFSPYSARTSYDMAQIDMTYTSASPQYGSPTQLDPFGASPPRKGLSVLDAPLPNSFDSNGISMAARNGPFASSVPSRFGLESPPSSLPQKPGLGSMALRNLHNSAFGNQSMGGLLATMGSSPPSGTDEPLTFAKRPLHSERFRAPRGMVSASLGTRLPTQSFDHYDDDEEEDDDDDIDREEDLLPASLRDLIPEGRSRRESRTRIDEDSGPAAFLAAQRRTISGHGTPQDNKVGSPSRYTNTLAGLGGFGHVGSPLRNSGLAWSTSPSNRPISNSELSPGISSPPRRTSMSALTQGLQRTKLDPACSAQHPSAPAPAVRTSSSSSSSNPGSQPVRAGLDRIASSTSVSKIEEEQDLFDMDEVGAAAAVPTSVVATRSSGGPPPPRSSSTRGPWDYKLQFGASSPGAGENGFGAIGAHRGSPAR